MESGHIMGVIAIFAVFGLPVLAIIVYAIGHYCYESFRTWQEVALKRDMVARGYAADEIVAVVAAKRGSKTKEKGSMSDIPPAKPVKEPAYSGTH
jgi:hypothetical protein